MENRLKIQVEPRYVKEDNRLRPFQKQAIEAITNSNTKLIFVEAPVGSGKSYIIRNLIQDDHFNRK